MPLWRSPGARAVSAAVLALTLAACGGGQGQGAQGGPGSGGGAPPPPQVGVVEVQPQSVSLSTELPGRVEPLRIAQVRARVSGVVLKRHFREGSEVKAGQHLFDIDPAPYRATLDSARATLARAQANLAQATATVTRYKPLAEANAISRQDFVNAQATQQAAAADVAAGRAAVQTARINLDYARVTSPIAGRIGRALVTEGALVSATEATQLATVQQTNRVYVNFTQSSTELLRLRKAVANQQLRSSGDTMPVSIVMEDGSVMKDAGKLLFSDIAVDETSGQITLRAEVDNADGLLLPGQYVRVRLSQAELPSGILLPQQAVTRTANGDTVLVVNAENKPTQRQIKIRSGQNGQWIVTDGLKPGEKVIVDGFQKMMVPGAPVTPVPWQASAPTGSSPASGAAPAGSAASGAAAPAASAASAR